MKQASRQQLWQQQAEQKQGGGSRGAGAGQKMERGMGGGAGELLGTEAWSGREAACASVRVVSNV